MTPLRPLWICLLLARAWGKLHLGYVEYEVTHVDSLADPRSRSVAPPFPLIGPSVQA